MPLWTAEMIDVLKTSDRSSSGIAAELNSAFNTNVTRNAVIGKMNRLGLSPKPRRYNDGQSRKPRRPPIERKSYNVITAKLAPLPPPEPETVIIPVDSAVLNTGLISIFDLKPTSCRWPHGHATPFLYCGQTVCNSGPNNSYCIDHALRAYMKSTPRINARPFHRAA